MNVHNTLQITNEIEPTKRLSKDLLSKIEKKELLNRRKLDIINRGNKLENLRLRNLSHKHINWKLYYLLWDPFTFNNAYAKISKNAGALTKAIDSKETILLFYRNKDAESIAKSFKEEKSKWSATRRTWIPKPGKRKKRPIDTPTQRDRIVQEAIRGILEAIYEPEFVAFEKEINYKCTNFGFRPNKSTWDAIETLKLGEVMTDKPVAL